MKKMKRTLLCLMLEVLMVASCAMTAMASESDTALIGGTLYKYTWSLTRSNTCGTGKMYTTETPAHLKVEVRNYLYSEVNDKYGYGAWVSNTGYCGVTTVASNVLVINEVNVPSQVISTDGRFYIDGTLVMTKNYVA